MNKKICKDKLPVEFESNQEISPTSRISFNHRSQTNQSRFTNGSSSQRSFITACIHRSDRGADWVEADSYMGF